MRQHGFTKNRVIDSDNKPQRGRSIEFRPEWNLARQLVAMKTMRDCDPCMRRITIISAGKAEGDNGLEK